MLFGESPVVLAAGAGEQEETEFWGIKADFLPFPFFFTQTEVGAADELLKQTVARSLQLRPPGMKYSRVSALPVRFHILSPLPIWKGGRASARAKQLSDKENVVFLVDAGGCRHPAGVLNMQSEPV